MRAQIVSYTVTSMLWLCMGCEPKSAIPPEPATPLASTSPARRVPEETRRSPLLLAREDAIATFIGRVRNPNTVEVETVLQGQLSVTTLSITPPLEVPLAVEDRGVMMVDANLEVFVYMVLVAGSSIEEGVLAVLESRPRDRFDVSGVLTLAQLETLLAQGHLEQEFTVVLSFADGHGGREQSTKRFELHHDWRGFWAAGPSGACVPELVNGNARWFGKRVSMVVDFSGNCLERARDPWRWVHFYGTPLGVDTQGDIILEFIPMMPFMHRNEYERLLDDSSIEFSYNFVELQIDGDERWLWNFDDDRMIDAQGVEHAGHNIGGDTMLVNGELRYSEFNYTFGDGMELRLEMIRPENGRFEPTLESIEAGSVECSLFDGKRERTCKTGAVGVVFDAITH